MDVSNEDFTDSRETDLPNSRSTYFVPRMSPGFFPSWSPRISRRSRFQDLDNSNVVELQKRITRLFVDPQDKRWSQVFRVSPKELREMRSNFQKFRPYLRREDLDGGFRMSYSRGKKRPAHYTEPEGSEFLGGPGK